MISKKEQECTDWFNSIEIVDDEGKVIPAVLVDDTSDDPDNDREE